MRDVVAPTEQPCPGDLMVPGAFFGPMVSCVSSITYIAGPCRVVDPLPWENLTLRLVALATTKQEKFKC